MKKLLNRRGAMLLLIAVGLACFIPIACKRTSLEKGQQRITASTISQLEKWWANLKASPQENNEILSRVPDGMNVQDYWRSQFQNGLPKWSNATVYTLNGETIYEVPFEFPDNLVLLDQRPSSEVQPFVSGYGSPGKSGKPSQSYLIVKPQPGRDTVAEIMLTVLDDSYMLQLDSMGVAYPFLRIHNVYPAANNTGAFTGSVKFYDLDGVQNLQQGYANGSLIDYLSYGRTPSFFSMTPVPQSSAMRAYQVCTWTHVYQQNCGADAGCTDWVLIAVIFNGCETIVFPDSPPLMPPISGGSGEGGGSAGYAPPSVQQQAPIPNARLCGGYKWKRVGDAHYCQLRNFGAAFVKTGSTIPPQYVVLGLTCIEIPSRFSNQGYDITEFVNYAYNKTGEKILGELDSGVLPPGSAFIELRFKELFRKYLVEHPGVDVSGASVTFHNGCLGAPAVPVTEPRYCPPPTL